MSKKYDGIVKVQLPLAGDPQVLVYNEDRSIEFMNDIPEALLEVMEDKKKMYFYYSMYQGMFSLKKEAPNQSW